jgi:hypothetical protein
MVGGIINTHIECGWGSLSHQDFKIDSKRYGLDDFRDSVLIGINHRFKQGRAECLPFHMLILSNLNDKLS